ncbi:MAG: hypothetical protein B7X45_02890 [Lysobacterales bacterium 15-68-25]|nr:MAG: hypothetical protein B7X45_02890 [Xanthomonadales bacterium 15-68-25]
MARLRPSIFRTQLDWMNGQTMPKMPNVTMVSSSTTPQCSEGGDGRSERRCSGVSEGSPEKKSAGGAGGALNAGSAAAAASGNTCFRGAQAAMPSHQASVSGPKRPSPIHWRTFASL